MVPPPPAAEAGTGADAAPAGPTGPVESVNLKVFLVGTGNGTVTAAGTDVMCPPRCQGKAPRGLPVTLTAAPDKASGFRGWSDPCSGADACQLTATGNVQIEARFDAAGTPLGYYAKPAQFWPVVGNDKHLYGAGNVRGKDFCPTASGSTNHDDVLITSLRYDGTVEWCARFPGRGMKTGYAESLAQYMTLARAGGVVVSGYTNDPVDFNGTMLGMPGRRQWFTARLDDTGKLLWVVPLGGGPVAENDDGVILVDDEAGAVYLNADGTVMTRVSTSAVKLGEASVTRSGTIVAGGTILRQTTLGAVTFPGTSNDGFVAEYNLRGGGYRWVVPLLGAGWDAVSTVSADPDGNVFVSGFFRGNARLGDRMLQAPIGAEGTDSLFLAQIKEGVVVWTRVSTGFAQVHADRRGDVYITGFGPADLGGGPRGINYFAKLSGKDGSHIWSLDLATSSTSLVIGPDSKVMYAATPAGIILAIP